MVTARLRRSRHCIHGQQYRTRDKWHTLHRQLLLLRRPVVAGLTAVLPADILPRLVQHPNHRYGHGWTERSFRLLCGRRAASVPRRA